MNKVLATFTYRHQAEYAQGFLEDAGIESLLLTDDVGGLHPGIAFSRPARIAVHQDDEDEARTVLEEAGLL